MTFKGRLSLGQPTRPAYNKYIRITTSFKLSTFKNDFQAAVVTWTTNTSPLAISTLESLLHLNYQHLKMTFKWRLSLGQPTRRHL